MWRERVESGAAVVVTTVVGVIGAAAGFTHTHDAAQQAGQAGWLAWADAVVIECLVVVAGFQVHRYRRASHSVRFPLGVLIVAFLVQMGAQVAGAPRTPAGWLFAAMPALGCLVVIKLVMRPTGVQVSRSPSPGQPEVVLDAQQRLGEGKDVASVVTLKRQPEAMASWPPR